MSVTVCPLDCIAGSSVAFLARHRHVNGTYATPANTAAVRAVATKDGITETLAENLTPGDVLFSSLQTDDPRWPLDCNDSEDETGFNFRYVAPPSAFPTPGHYRVEFKLTHTDTSVTKIVFEGPARSSST